MRNTEIILSYAKSVATFTLRNADDKILYNDFATLVREWWPGALDERFPLEPHDLCAAAANVRRTGRQGALADRPLHDGLGGQNGRWEPPHRNPLAFASRAIWRVAAEHNLVRLLYAYVHAPHDSSFIPPAAVAAARERVIESLRGQGSYSYTNNQDVGTLPMLRPDGQPAGSLSEIAEGQPFLLNLVEQLAWRVGDVDVVLAEILRQGVKLGIDAPIPYSGVFERTKPEVPQHPAEMLVHFENWPTAEQHPQLTQKLLKTEVDPAHNFVKGGVTLDEVKIMLNSETLAVGKLHIAYLEPGAEHEPRLVYDATVSGSNPNARVEEKCRLPGVPEAADIDNSDFMIGLKLDVKKAFKRVMVHPSQWKYLLFTFGGLFYFWCVLPFGHALSSLWWQRTGALMGRLTSFLLGEAHARLLYVDDYLWRFAKQKSWTHAAVVILIFEILGIPMSYAKLQFGV